MKIAVIYNRESKRVINLFGVPNREHYGKQAIRRIVNALKKGGHSVRAFEGDRDLIDKLQDFMPGVLKGERPGMAFNLSYGVQGQARYTHVPSILEMVGIPYVGSGPLAHSLALDKVVAKMVFTQQGIPTPEFAVLTERDFPMQELVYPAIVKPKNESVSFGIKIVNSPEELREAAAAIFDAFDQHVLVERYIDGREINVGLLGNHPAETFPPAEILFGETGPKIYTMEDKQRSSGREVGVACPAELDAETAARAQKIARQAFDALGCYDCARVDMRMDEQGNLYVLEVNSLPSLGEHGSYVAAAEAVGLDFPALVNRLVEVSSARYFGTPAPPAVTRNRRKPAEAVFDHLTSRRDRLEGRVREWVNVSSRTSDPVGRKLAATKLREFFDDVGMRPMEEFAQEPRLVAAQTAKGFEGGTLLVGQLDDPRGIGLPTQPFRRDPEWMYGEGIGSSRAPLVMMEYALRSLRASRQLRTLPLGVIYYTDEGHDCRYSRQAIQAAAKKAARVLVLRPGNQGNKVVTARRGQRKYTLTIEGKPVRLGRAEKGQGPLRWLMPRLEEISALSSRKERIAVAAEDLHTESYPELLPHRVTVKILLSFSDEKKAMETEQKIRHILGRGPVKWTLNLISDRSPMRDRRTNRKLLREISGVAEQWEIPIGEESSLWPSVAGLVSASVPVVCGIGPVAKDLYTSQEGVHRVSLVQRTLLLSQFLLSTKGR